MRHLVWAYPVVVYWVSRWWDAWKYQWHTDRALRPVKVKATVMTSGLGPLWDKWLRPIASTWQKVEEAGLQADALQREYERQRIAAEWRDKWQTVYPGPEMAQVLVPPELTAGPYDENIVTMTPSEIMEMPMAEYQRIRHRIVPVPHRGNHRR